MPCSNYAICMCQASGQLSTQAFWTGFWQSCQDRPMAACFLCLPWRRSRQRLLLARSRRLPSQRKSRVNAKRAAGGWLRQHLDLPRFRARWPMLACPPCHHPTQRHPRQLARQGHPPPSPHHPCPLPRTTQQHQAVQLQLPTQHDVTAPRPAPFLAARRSLPCSRPTPTTSRFDTSTAVCAVRSFCLGRYPTFEVRWGLQSAKCHGVTQAATHL